MKKALICLTLGLLLAGPAVLRAAAEDLTPTDAARCPVCGMFVSPYPNWVSVIAFKDGSREFFDGPKDMFNYYFSLDEYRPGATPAAVEGLWVTDYYTLQRTPATEVYFITGSDVLGPMGHELVPVAGREAAETFMRDHQGKKMLRLSDGELKDANEEK